MQPDKLSLAIRCLTVNALIILKVLRESSKGPLTIAQVATLANTGLTTATTRLRDLIELGLVEVVGYTDSPHPQRLHSLSERFKNNEGNVQKAFEQRLEATEKLQVLDIKTSAVPERFKALLRSTRQMIQDHWVWFCIIAQTENPSLDLIVSSLKCKRSTARMRLIRLENLGLIRVNADLSSGLGDIYQLTELGQEMIDSASLSSPSPSPEPSPEASLPEGLSKEILPSSPQVSPTSQPVTLARADRTIARLISCLHRSIGAIATAHSLGQVSSEQALAEIEMLFSRSPFVTGKAG